MTKSEEYRSNALILMTQGDQEETAQNAWSKYNAAIIWFNRIGLNYPDDFTKDDYDNRAYCQRMMNQL
jgi:hypothetical protein